MRKVKYFIPLFILFLTIGFATVNQTLSIKGSATNQSNISDFDVYFSGDIVEYTEETQTFQTNTKLVKNDKELVFTTTLLELGDTYVIEYNITNGSKYFDAEFNVSCTQSNNYLKITNVLDTSNLTALETRQGILLLEKTQTNAAEENIKHTVTCTITATPVERETVQEGEAADPIFFEFSVEGVHGGKTATYQAITGMTWEDWVKSEYNVDNFNIYNSTSEHYVIYGEYDSSQLPLLLWNKYGDEGYEQAAPTDLIESNIIYKWAIII